MPVNYLFNKLFEYNNPYFPYFLFANFLFEKEAAKTFQQNHLRFK